MAPSRFVRGTEYSSEGFVQTCIERHFLSLGFQSYEMGYADLACIHPITQQRWVIEAKGETTDVGLDFRTGLGQLIFSMSDETTTYAVAVPHTKKFISQLRRVPDRIRSILHIHWLIVNEDGSVMVVSPSQQISSS